MVTSWECFVFFFAYLHRKKIFFYYFCMIEKIINDAINSFAISLFHLTCLGDLPCQYIQNYLVWAATWCDRLPLR